MSEFWQYIEVKKYQNEVEDAIFMLENVLKACKFECIGTIQDITKAEESLKTIEIFFDEVFYK